MSLSRGSVTRETARHSSTSDRQALVRSTDLRSKILIRRHAGTTLTVVSMLVMALGAGLVLQPFYTDRQASTKQEVLAGQFQTSQTKEAFEARSVATGSPVTRLLIPRLGVDTIVVEGTSEEALSSGAGHYPETPLPGEPGNVGIAGHRTTYGKPFADLDQLVPGDTVVLETPVGPYVYQMVPGFDGHANPWVVKPDDWSVVAPTSQPMLTLTTCHPKGSARERLIARLRLVESPADK